MTKKAATIILTGGGSGGHIAPLLPLARELKKQKPSCRLVYIGLKGDKIDGLQSQYQVFDRVYHIPAGKFRRYHGESLRAHLADYKTILLNVRDIFRTIHGFFAALRILSKEKPAVVFSKGGYVAVPVGLAAKLRATVIITHDSDAIPGLANKIVGRFARVHATGMPAQNYPYPKNTIRYTGIPVDERFGLVGDKEQTHFKESLKLPSHSQLILVEGGGLGSSKLNNLMTEVAPELLGNFPDSQIIHLCGTAHETQVREQYGASLDPQQYHRVKVLGFSSELYNLSGAADIVVARAGASTVAELALQAKACIIIPSPFLAGGHQLKNAQILKEQGAAEVLDNDINDTDFLVCLSSLLSDKDRRTELSKNLATLAKPQAAHELAAIILKSLGTVND
jgi:UDP-N-acetylglucosamine--N-acetylmuramyl-(pentapeptide) pyrophosphoryl-undecaprenol N-acetylglucosamine transferase